jgi:hypothetical protein
MQDGIPAYGPDQKELDTAPQHITITGAAAVKTFRVPVGARRVFVQLVPDTNTAPTTTWMGMVPNAVNDVDAQARAQISGCFMLPMGSSRNFNLGKGAEWTSVSFYPNAGNEASSFKLYVEFGEDLS